MAMAMARARARLRAADLGRGAGPKSGWFHCILRLVLLQIRASSTVYSACMTSYTSYIMNAVYKLIISTAVVVICS
jgi:hypothetical protein